MLLFVAFIAVSLVFLHQLVLLRSARQHYENAVLGWEHLYLELPDVVAASESLMNVETQTLWISEKTARRHHIANLKELLRTAENRLWQVPLEDQENYQDQCKSIRSLIEDQADVLRDSVGGS